MTEQELVDQLLDEGIQPMELYYSEIKSFSDDSILGYRSETVIRSLELGEIGPQQYMPVANLSESGVGVFMWSLRQACREYITMEREGLALMKWISIRVPMNAVESMNFEETLKTVFEEEQFTTPANICLEFPMQAIEIDRNVLIEAVKGVRNAGVSVMLEGVGDTNYPMGRLFGTEITYALIAHSVTSKFQENGMEVAAAEAVAGYIKAIGILPIACGIDTSGATARQNAEAAGCVAFSSDSAFKKSLKDLMSAK